MSSESTRDLAKWVRSTPRKPVANANGVPVNRNPSPDRAWARAELAIQDETPVIGTVARLEPEEGPDRLLRPFARVRSAHSTALLLFCGDGPEQPMLESLAETLGMGDAVRFLGLRLDVPRLLPAFGVFGLSAVREGLPMALVEAMACEVPIVAMNVGGVSRAARPGHTGILVPDGDEEALADGMSRLLADPAGRHRLGVSGRRVFMNEFTADGMFRRSEAIYTDGAAALPGFRDAAT